jgi:hypothetical protein
VDTPFNDSVVFRRNGIDSVVINPIPPINEKQTVGLAKILGSSLIIQLVIVIEITVKQ